MHIKAILLFGLVAIWKRAEGAPCNCGLGPGVNVCSSGGGVGGVPGGGSGEDGGNGGNGPCYPLVVRPQNLPSIDLGSFSKPRVICKTVEGSDVSPLKPVGGLCSCGRTIVRPAVVPRPACGYCSSGSSITSNTGSESSNSQNSQSSSSSQVFSHGSGGSTSVHYPACGPPIFKHQRQVPQAAADIVSQDIAYRRKHQRTNDKAELLLTYGFQRAPAEAPCTKKQTKFREGNIHLVNGQVLELANNAPCEEEDVEEEYVEEEEPEEIEVLTPTFGDLGYRLANYDSGKFVNVVAEEQQQSACGDDHHGVVSACGDGYRAGEVVIREGQVDSQIPPQVPISPICDDEDVPRARSSGSVYYEGPSYSSYSHSSSSSSSSNKAQHVFLEKIGCSK